MNYIVRLIICFVFLFIIYEAFQILVHQKKMEKFLGYALNISKGQMDIERKKREEAYKKLGTPSEWYKFKDQGYSYLDPKYWKVPQPYQPVCYDKDDTFPAPIMSSGTDDAMFYKPGKNDKYINEEMKFEIKPKIVYKTTVYTRKLS
jgi:hypothetical protein